MKIDNELRDKVYECAKEHGFHDKEYSIRHYLMLIITEISETVDADRNNKYANVIGFANFKINSKPVIKEVDKRRFISYFECYIKDSVEDEFADIILRCLDLMGIMNINVNIDEQKIFSPKLFGKEDISQTLTEFMFNMISEYLCDSSPLILEVNLIYLLGELIKYSKMFNIPLSWHIKQKMKYNKLRPRLNGKKY